MRPSRAGATCPARVFILASALAVLGFAHLYSFVAKGQSTRIPDTTGQSYYVNAKTLLDDPLPDLLRAVPELQGLEPAGNQDELAFILDKAGKMTEDLLGRMPNLISHEEITQEKLSDQGGVKGQLRQDFDYLILTHRQDGVVTPEEYRTGRDGSPLATQGLEQGYSVTRGFASAWLHFHPWNRSGARFRYLGQQTDGGLRCYVVAFAQRPGWATSTGRVVFKEGFIVILYQGIAWIDEASFRIVRLRVDLLAPRLDIGLEKQTTELRYGETRLPQAVSPLWLPQEVVVTTGANNQVFRNVHRYSGYRLFKVETKILPAPPDQPLLKRPN